MTMQETVKSKVMTEADLPEIKVADPIPQPEPLFDGEDFLEKTDSFIGRMKWSISGKINNKLLSGPDACVRPFT